MAHIPRHRAVADRQLRPSLSSSLPLEVPAVSQPAPPRVSELESVLSLSLLSLPESSSSSEGERTGTMPLDQPMLPLST